jgi:hypothetical protein
MTEHPRIALDAGVLASKPVVRGTLCVRPLPRIRLIEHRPLAQRRARCVTMDRPDALS